MSMPTRTLYRLFLWIAVVVCSCAAPALAQTGPRVIIDSSPPGAAVYVDGKHNGVQGYSSGTFKIRLSKGPHKMLLELEGYKPVEQVINVSQAQKFTFTMERAPARLEVRPPGTNESARGGEVFIDGAPAGTVPVPVEVPSGRHLVEVRKPGYRVYSETLELRAGDARTLWVTLQSEVKSGGLLVAADASAEVFVDGQPRGAAPVMVDNLPEGDHLVEVRRTEPGSPPWRQNVRVLSGQQVKVLAQTHGPAPSTGSLLVVCNTPDAEVIVDGTTKAKANQEISGLRPGQHVVDVRSKSTAPMNKVVDIEAGKQRVVQVELQQSAEVRGVGMLRVLMLNPVEGAQYFINGRKVDEGTILGERGVEVPAGQNVLVVRREGYGETRKDVTIRAGGVEMVNVDLRNTGKVVFSSEPSGAQVFLDNQRMGQTPLTLADVAAGQHLVKMELAGFPPVEQAVPVQGGMQVPVMVKFAKQEAPPPPQVDPAVAHRGMSSYSAQTIDPGKFTTDVAVGYPYFFDLRLTVGAVRKGAFGIDAGAELRSNFYMTEVAVNARAQLIKAGPIALGATLMVGGGGGPRQRNTFNFEAGVPVTLLAGNLVKLSVIPTLQVYSDQLCPTLSYIRNLSMRQDLTALQQLVRAEHVGDRCTGGENPDAGIPIGSGMGRYRNAIADAAGYSERTIAGATQPFADVTRSPYDAANPIYREDVEYDAFNQPILGTGTAVLDRFTGARFILRAAIEVAATANTNFFVIVEAPFPRGRQAFTDKFNRVFPEGDLPIYGRMGFTLKF